MMGMYQVQSRRNVIIRAIFGLSLNPGEMVRITSPFVFLFISPYTLQIFSITSSFPLFFAPVEQKKIYLFVP
jgi:hypothetical protein